MNESSKEPLGKESLGGESKKRLTKLVSSGEVNVPEVSAWKLSGFVSDQPKPDTDADSSKRVSEAVQKQIEPELKKRTELLKKAAFDNAHKEGYAAGFAKGTEAGKEEATKVALEELRVSFAPRLARFDQILSLLAEPYEKLEAQVLSEMIDLTLHVAEQVIQKEIAQDTEWMVNAIHAAVKVLPEESGSIEVQLHPDDLDSLKMIESALADEWALKSSTVIEVGTCVVKHENSSVLNSWTARFDEVASTLKDKSRMPVSQVALKDE